MFLVFICSLCKTYIEYILGTNCEKKPRNVHLQIRRLSFNCGMRIYFSTLCHLTVNSRSSSEHKWHSSPNSTFDTVILLFLSIFIMDVPILTTTGDFCGLGLVPSEKSLPTVLQKQSLKAALGQSVGKAHQLVMAGSWPVSCIEDQWGHSNLEAMVLWLSCIPPDGDVLYLWNDAASVGLAFICFCS